MLTHGGSAPIGCILRLAMTTVVSMLRGINVGGNRIIKMDALRALYESLGLERPQTFIQSGNVVFRTKARAVAPLAKKIEDAIERTFGFRSDVLCRTSAELRSVIARNPFAKRQDINPGKLLVVFLSGAVDNEARKKLLEIKAEPEELLFDGCELYIYFPNGQARPNLSMAQVERAHKRAWTGRNWNTVTKLLEIAESMEA
jgi:uncharacterized protein (DUF1697 family)